MSDTSATVGRRACLLLAAVALATVAVLRLAGPAVAAVAHPSVVAADPRFDVLLRALLAAALLAGWLWCGLGVVLLVVRLVVGEARNGGAPSVRPTAPWLPSAVRNAVLAALGVAVTGGLGLPAVADPVGRPEPAAVAAAGVAGLSLPDRMAVPATHDLSAAAEPADVVVAPGDSLWAISARLLPDRAGDARIARACRSLYRANAERIGPDPDRIYPGARLLIPDALVADRKEAS